MSETSPQPNAGSKRKKSKIRNRVADRGLTGCANDTKWGKLLDAMRARDQWTPSFRFKCVDGSPSRWDVEWWHHLPFPMMSVEWFDITYLEEIEMGVLVEAQVIDHSDWILEILNVANFCYDVVGEIIRIFGYLPKSFEGLETNDVRPNEG